MSELTPTDDYARRRALRRVERAVARAASQRALWPAGATLVVAVSGGADSLCLLGALLALRDDAARGRRRAAPPAPARLIVATLDHGLRGEAGAEDARWVAELAATLGLPCVAERVDTLAYARERRRSLEDAARELRYRMLQRVAREAGAAAIAVGHTRDDQAETVVMRFVRGAGLAGLAGMAPRVDEPPIPAEPPGGPRAPLVRPLLDLARAETEAYCAARGWRPRHDASNDDPRYLRNRIRAELLPLLARYNATIVATLARNATLLAGDDAYLEAQTAAAWDTLAPRVEPSPEHTERERRVRFDRAALAAQPPALRRRLVRRATLALGFAVSPLEAIHLLAVEALLAEGQGSQTLDLPAGLRVRIEPGALLVERLPSRSAAATGEARDEDAPLAGAYGVALPIPGAVELPGPMGGMGWRVRAWRGARDETPAGLEGEAALPPAPTLAPFVAAGYDAEAGRAQTRVYLDADVAGDALTVRAWRPGDRFQPLGMRHEKKAQDYFVDAKVPRALRQTLPIVFGNGRPLWLAGLRIDERAKLTPQTRRVLALQLEPWAP